MSPIVFGTSLALGTPTVLDSGEMPDNAVEIAKILVPLRDEFADHRAAANAAGSASEPQAQGFAGFNLAMCATTSSRVAHPMKYRQIIS